MRRRRKSRPYRRSSGCFSSCAHVSRPGVARSRSPPTGWCRRRGVRARAEGRGRGEADGGEPREQSGLLDLELLGSVDVDAPRRRVGLALGAEPDPRVSAKPRGGRGRAPAVRAEPHGNQAPAGRRDAATTVTRAVKPPDSFGVVARHPVTVAVHHGEAAARPRPAPQTLRTLPRRTPT